MINFKNKKPIKIIVLLFLFFIIFSCIPKIFAESNTNSVDIICAKYDYPWCKEVPSGFGGIINRFYTIALGFAGASALGVLIYGAILWTLSGAVTSKQDALEWIWGAVWGLVLLMGAYLILNTINPDLINLKEPEIIQAKPILESSEDVIEKGQTIFWKGEIKCYVSGLVTGENIICSGFSKDACANHCANLIKYCIFSGKVVSPCSVAGAGSN